MFAHYYSKAIMNLLRRVYAICHTK